MTSRLCYLGEASEEEAECDLYYFVGFEKERALKMREQQNFLWLGFIIFSITVFLAVRETQIADLHN